jgi:hypothetical protein
VFAAAWATGQKDHAPVAARAALRVGAATKAQDPSMNTFLANFEHTLTDVEVEMIGRGYALFPDLRNELTAVAHQARESALGIWPSDKTTAGFDVTGNTVKMTRPSTTWFRREVTAHRSHKDSNYRRPSASAPGGS